MEQRLSQKFVIDENTIIFAETLTDANGNHDTSSLKLIVDIEHNCHRIVLDRRLEKQYLKKFRQLLLDHKGLRSPTVVRILLSLQNNSSKADRIEYVPRLDGDDDLPDDNRDMVLLAIRTNAILVTQDDRLIRKFTSSEVSKTHNCTILGPKEALGFAQPKAKGF